MLKVGLTGGIGSGKSAVSALLQGYGAFLIDSDVNAREVVAKGTPGLAAIVEEFGEGVLLGSGELDRPALGQIVFGDPDRLARLNAIVHPLVIARTAELMQQAEGAEVLVHDIPLLVETGAQGQFDVVVVVAASPQTQLERLVGKRGMSEQDARQRIAAQLPLADKVAVATHVIHNDGPLSELEPQVRALWERLVGPPT
jgi:dephospho-CoA kinase